MKNRTQALTLAAMALVGLAVAQSGRVIDIKGGRSSGNPRNGPLEFSGDFLATVQKLNIKAQKAVLTAPEGQTLSEAQGKRIANFDGSVVATRGRMIANGPSLEYKESTGLGILAGPTNVVQKPEKQGDDEVTITGAKATFDVDTDISTSEGNVKVVNGKQSGTSDKVVFDEKVDLACMYDKEKVTLVREPKKEGQNKLTIVSRESRMLTKTKLLVATGGVTLVAGDNTTTGEALYYDDEKETAWVVGNISKGIPAKNVNKKNNATVTAGTIINRTQKNQIERLGNVFSIPFDKFKCPSDK